MSWSKLCWRCVAFGALLLGGVLAGGVLARILDRDPTVQIDTITAANDVTVASGRINIRSHFDKTRNCDTDVGRFLWRPGEHDGEDERIIVPLTPTNTSLTGVGPDQRIVISLDVPTRISPGRWFYYSIAEVKCGLFSLTQFRRTADIPIDLYPAE